MKKNLQLVILLVIGITFNACATIVNGSSQNMKFLSKPSGATIVIKDSNGLNVGEYTTPTSATLKRGDGYFSGQYYNVEVKKEGYKTMTFSIASRISGWYIAGNLFFGGLIGWLAVDPATGAMYVLELEEKRNVRSKDDKILITLIEDVPEEKQSQMRRIK